MAPVAGLTFAFERIETSMDLAVIDDRTSTAVVASFRLEALGRTGRLKVVIPRSAVQSSRSGSQRRAADLQETHDPNWRRQMEDGVKSADVKLRAVLEERRMTLKEIASLKVGQVIALKAGINTNIKLECNNEPLFLCRVGQSDGAYTVRVEKVLKRPEPMAA